MSNKGLVIDNDQNILDPISIILQHAIYNVIASRSEDVIDNILDIEPELILLAYWLEGRKGHDHCRTLKLENTTSPIPIVIISTINELEQVASGRMADNYIQKPFDINYLGTVFAPAVN